MDQQGDHDCSHLKTSVRMGEAVRRQREGRDGAVHERATTGRGDGRARQLQSLTYEDRQEGMSARLPVVEKKPHSHASMNVNAQHVHVHVCR